MMMMAMMMMMIMIAAYHGCRLVWAWGVRFSGKWNSIWMSERMRKVDDGQGYFYQGGQGALPP